MQDPSFPDAAYAGKIIMHGDGPLSTEQLAIHEARGVNIHHRGIVSPLGFMQGAQGARPMLLYKFWWNGGTLEQWIGDLKYDMSRPVPRSYLPTSGSAESVQEHIFHIINGLLRTINYMHDNALTHNDLHGRNIMLHFEDSRVYVGLIDWGKATLQPIEEHFPALGNDTDATKEEAQKRLNFCYVAPECLSSRPPPYTVQLKKYIVFVGLYVDCWMCGRRSMIDI